MDEERRKVEEMMKREAEERAEEEQREEEEARSRTARWQEWVGGPASFSAHHIHLEIRGLKQEEKLPPA